MQSRKCGRALSIPHSVSQWTNFPEIDKERKREIEKERKRERERVRKKEGERKREIFGIWLLYFYFQKE
jgi:hypothetical protein